MFPSSQWYNNNSDEEDDDDDDEMMFIRHLLYAEYFSKPFICTNFTIWGNTFPKLIQILIYLFFTTPL